MKPLDSKKDYQDYVNKKSPNSPIWKNCFNAFWVGGLICSIGQIIMDICKYRGLSQETSGTIVSILLIVMNKSVKPILNAIMLPINIYTLGLTYPLVNVFVLKIISLLLGSHFILDGWLCAFFISIFISVMSIVIDNLIGREIRSVKL